MPVNRKSPQHYTPQFVRTLNPTFAQPTRRQLFTEQPTPESAEQPSIHVQSPSQTEDPTTPQTQSNQIPRLAPPQIQVQKPTPLGNHAEREYLEQFYHRAYGYDYLNSALVELSNKHQPGGALDPNEIYPPQFLADLLSLTVDRILTDHMLEQRHIENMVDVTQTKINFLKGKIPVEEGDTEKLKLALETAETQNRYLQSLYERDVANMRSKEAQLIQESLKTAQDTPICPEYLEKKLMMLLRAQEPEEFNPESCSLLSKEWSAMLSQVMEENEDMIERNMRTMVDFLEGVREVQIQLGRLHLRKEELEKMCQNEEDRVRQIRRYKRMTRESRDILKQCIGEQAYQALNLTEDTVDSTLPLESPEGSERSSSEYSQEEPSSSPDMLTTAQSRLMATPQYKLQVQIKKMVEHYEKQQNARKQNLEKRRLELITKEQFYKTGYTEEERREYGFLEGERLPPKYDPDEDKWFELKDRIATLKSICATGTKFNLLVEKLSKKLMAKHQSMMIKRMFRTDQDTDESQTVLDMSDDEKGLLGDLDEFDEDYGWRLFFIDEVLEKTTDDDEWEVMVLKVAEKGTFHPPPAPPAPRKWRGQRTSLSPVRTFKQQPQHSTPIDQAASPVPVQYATPVLENQQQKVTSKDEEPSAVQIEEVFSEEDESNWNIQNIFKKQV